MLPNHFCSMVNRLTGIPANPIQRSVGQIFITLARISKDLYHLNFASGPPKPAPEPSPNPPKLPGTAGVLPGPSGKLVYSHTRHQKNTMVYGAQCSSTVLPGSRFFYRLFFASGPPKPAPEPMQCNEFAMACTLFRSWW